MSRSRVLLRVHHEARLTFSSSATSFARGHAQRSAGRRVNQAPVDSQPEETEDAAEERKSDASEREEEEALDRWLLAGEEKVNESAIRSHKNPYEHFRKNVAPSFHEPSPRNWLGRDVPFPLNPSFKPPIPLSDELRTRLYRACITDPKLNSVRALATRHHLSMKRVDAILRLKSVEESWKKSKSLQTGFTKGMEHLLGVTEATKRASQNTELVESIGKGAFHERYDVEEADLQDEVEGNDRARRRYQRLFWESVPEGEEPVMLNVLGTQQGPTPTGTKSKGKTILVERSPGRPAIMFVDVGNTYVDAKEKERREREGTRRSTLKARKRLREHGLPA